MQTWLESWYLNCRPRVSVFELQTWGLTIGPPGLENPGFKYPLCNFLLSSCSVINWAIIDWCVNAMAVGLNFWKHIFYGNLVLPSTVPDFTFPICCCCWPSQTRVWGNICILSPKVSLEFKQEEQFWKFNNVVFSYFLLAIWPPHCEIFYHRVLSNSYLYHNLRQFANLGCSGWHYHHRHYQHGWRGVACWSWWPSSYWYLLITIVNMILWDVECSILIISIWYQHDWRCVKLMQNCPFARHFPSSLLQGYLPWCSVAMNWLVDVITWTKLKSKKMVGRISSYLFSRYK